MSKMYAVVKGDTEVALVKSEESAYEKVYNLERKEREEGTFKPYSYEVTMVDTSGCVADYFRDVTQFVMTAQDNGELTDTMVNLYYNTYGEYWYIDIYLTKDTDVKCNFVIHEHDAKADIEKQMNDIATFVKTGVKPSED